MVRSFRRRRCQCAHATSPTFRRKRASTPANLSAVARARECTQTIVSVCTHMLARSPTFVHPAVMRVRAPRMPRSRRLLHPIFAPASAHVRSPSPTTTRLPAAVLHPAGRCPWRPTLSSSCVRRRSISPRRAQAIVWDVAPRIIALTLTCSATHPVARARENAIFYRTHHFKEL